MKVTSTIITKVAEATTENGSYNLEYSITDGILERVQTTAFKPSTNEQRIAVGSIYYDRGSVTINMPFSSDMSKYVADVCTKLVMLILVIPFLQPPYATTKECFVKSTLG